MSAYNSRSRHRSRGTGFIREGCLTDNKDALNVPAPSRINPVPRDRTSTRFSRRHRGMHFNFYALLATNKTEAALASNPAHTRLNNRLPLGRANNLRA